MYSAHAVPVTRPKTTQIPENTHTTQTQHHTTPHNTTTHTTRNTCKKRKKKTDTDTDKDRRQYRYEPPPEFPLTLPCSCIVPHLSGVNACALSQTTRKITVGCLCTIHSFTFSLRLQRSTLRNACIVCGMVVVVLSVVCVGELIQQNTRKKNTRGRKEEVETW